MTRYLVYSAVGFVMGGLLFSYYIPKWLKHIDIREKSKDHNPGTANAFMLAGSTVGTLCLICDLMKGLVPVAAAAQRLDVTNLAFAAVLIGPVLGHACGPFNGWKGGKSIAVSFGVLIALLPVDSSVWILVISYLAALVLIRHRPNEKKTIYAYGVLAIYEGYQWLIVGRRAVALGILGICAIVIHRNLAGLKAEKENRIMQEQVEICHCFPSKRRIKWNRSKDSGVEADGSNKTEQCRREFANERTDQKIFGKLQKRSHGHGG